MSRKMSELKTVVPEPSSLRRKRCGVPCPLSSERNFRQRNTIGDSSRFEIARSLHYVRTAAEHSQILQTGPWWPAGGPIHRSGTQIRQCQMLTAQEILRQFGKLFFEQSRARFSGEQTAKNNDKPQSYKATNQNIVRRTSAVIELDLFRAVRNKHVSWLCLSTSEL